MTRGEISMKCKKTTVIVDNVGRQTIGDINNYIVELEQQCKKQQEVIDNINLIIKGLAYGGNEDYYMENFSKINELLKEVSY